MGIMKSKKMFLNRMFNMKTHRGGAEASEDESKKERERRERRERKKAADKAEKAAMEKKIAELQEELAAVKAVPKNATVPAEAPAAKPSTPRGPHYASLKDGIDLIGHAA